MLWCYKCRIRVEPDWTCLLHSEKAQKLAQAWLHRARRWIQASAGGNLSVYQGASEQNLPQVDITTSSTCHGLASEAFSSNRLKTLFFFLIVWCNSVILKPINSFLSLLDHLKMHNWKLSSWQVLSEEIIWITLTKVCIFHRRKGFHWSMFHD